MMTRPLAGVLLWFLWAGSAIAAQETPVHSGAWSLELQLQPTSGATRYGIATKYHVSDRSAARLGFLYSYSSSDGGASGEQSTTTTTNSTTQTYHSESTSEVHNGSVFLHFARYVRVQDRLSVTWELGPVFAWDHAEYVETYPGQAVAGGLQTNTYNFDDKSYGLDLQAGFEWHFIRRLSLAGRYGISGVRTDGRRIVTRDSYDPLQGHYDVIRDEVQTDGFSVQTTNGVFSLIAYW